MTAGIRCFVALGVSEVVRARAKEIIDQLSSSRADFGWVRPENLHVTLKFLGEIDEGLIEPLCEALSAALDQVKPFSVEFSGVGAFPSIRDPRVIWLGVGEGASALTELARRTEAALSPFSPPERRGFVPHLTLGRRRRSERGLGALASFLAGMGEQDAGWAEAREIALMKSDLTPRGPRYSCVRRFPLTGS